MDAGGSGRRDDDAAWRPPEVRTTHTEELEGYTDLVEIGRGGDSIVFRAQQVALHRDVAIKVLLVDDPQRAARFAREVEITVSLGRQHPNIVTVLAIGTTASGRPAIVMDFFESGTVHDHLAAYGPMAAEEVARVGAVLADALSFAHERGILHRDVKPQNVLVLPTSWVLADFGIARLTDAEHTSSAETFTYRHAAPQVLDGYAPTVADDIWSLGSTLYTLLDGRPPFASDDPDDDSALAYLRRARTEPHRPLRAPGAERIAPIIDRCLQKRVEDRWSSAADLRDALQGLRGSAWEPAAGPAVEAAVVPAAPEVTSPRDAPAPADAAPVAPLPPADPAPAATPPRPVSPSLAGATPAEPCPGALSAVSHAALDATPTGTGMPDVTGGHPEAGAPPSAPTGLEEEPRRRRRLPLVLGATALTIGLVLGVVGAALRGGDDGDPPPVRAVPTEGVPSLTESPTDAPTFRGRPSRDLAFVLRSIDYDGVNLSAEWTDPSEGEGTFALYAIDPAGERLLATFPAGQTSASLPLQLPPGRACYYMVVLTVGGEYGVTSSRARPCITNRIGG